MDRRLTTLISNYKASVRAAVALMEQSGIPRPTSNVEWALYRPQIKELAGGVRFRKHGYGCLVELPDGAVDFDFGERGEIDGFDPYRLARFAGSKLAKYGFASAEALREALEAEAAAGALLYSRGFYYSVGASQ